ncbi:peptidyl-Lys metalloendopeptidase [Trametopsis cervina]|nr:peptidyl-Lys metalloendopeptidase [Trametopsis cervina]
MFTTTLRSTLIALVASAVAVSATPGLTLTLSGADKVDGVNNLKIVATVKNTGDETLKLLNDPRGVLNKLPTEAFQITHDNTGASPAFTGVKVKYVPSTAAKIGSSFTVLAPGEETSVVHDLSTAFNFTSTGQGSYSFAAKNQFFYVDPETNSPVEFFADHPQAHTAAISGKLAVARPTVSKRATYTGCSSSQQSQLVSAASAAQSYAAAAYQYTSTNTASTPRFTTWFGTYTSAHHSTILTHYSNLNGNTYSGYHFDCTCTESDTYAYVYPDDFGHVYLCGAFWQAPTTGTDSKGGTLIHESSHFTKNAGTQDYVYGQSAAKSLAKSNSAEAIENADNHEYYAENNPAQS